MKILVLYILSYIPLTLISQAVIEGKWKIQCGASTMSKFKNSSAFNLRYISPKFRWSDEDLTEEQEKHASHYKKTRIMFELIYSPPFNNFCFGLNVQHQMLKYKRTSLEAYGGIKLFFLRGNDFTIKRPFIKGSSKGVWYLNAGLLLQINLNSISPFFDVGYDGITTVGAEFNLHSIYKKPKGRYRLNTINGNN